MRLAKLTKRDDDFKSCLWSPLSLKQKFELYLKTTRQRERELISLLFLLDFKENININKQFFSKEIDKVMRFNKYVESTLSNMMYEKYIMLCENQTTKAKIRKLVKFMKESLYHQQPTISFVKFLHETQDKCKNLIEKNETFRTFKKQATFKNQISFY